MLAFFKRLFCSHQWKSEYTSFNRYPCLKIEVLECTKCGKAKTKSSNHHVWGAWERSVNLYVNDSNNPYYLMVRHCKSCGDIDTERKYV